MKLPGHSNFKILLILQKVGDFKRLYEPSRERLMVEDDDSIKSE